VVGYSIVNMDEFLKSNAGVLILSSFDKNEIDNFYKGQKNVKVVMLRE